MVCRVGTFEENKERENASRELLLVDRLHELLAAAAW
jgi:hypothetical protein